MRDNSINAVVKCSNAITPLAIADDKRLAPLVRDVRRGLIRALQAALNQQCVALGHWTFLRILWVEDGINQRKLSDLAGVMEPTTFAALQAMERLGYITRQRRPDNRKNIYVFLTSDGRALEDRLMPIALAINARASKGVSDADLAATRRTMLQMAANLSEERSEVECAPRAAAPMATPLRSALPVPLVKSR